MVLATDMARHFTDLAHLKGRLATDGKNIFYDIFLIIAFILIKKVLI